MFHINCFTSVYFLIRALLSDQKVTGFAVTVLWCIQCDVLHSCVGVLLTNRVTNSMEQIPYFGADFRSAGQEISCLVWERNVIYCLQRSHCCDLCHLNQVNITTPYIIFPRKCFNAALTSSLDLSSSLAHSRSHQDVYTYTNHVPITLQHTLILTRNSIEFSVQLFLYS
jgi:hypothetical protein